MSTVSTMLTGEEATSALDIDADADIINYIAQCCIDAGKVETGVKWLTAASVHVDIIVDMISTMVTGSYALMRRAVDAGVIQALVAVMGAFTVPVPPSSTSWWTLRSSLDLLVQVALSSACHYTQVLDAGAVEVMVAVMMSPATPVDSKGSVIKTLRKLAGQTNADVVQALVTQQLSRRWLL